MKEDFAANKQFLELAAKERGCFQGKRKINWKSVLKEIGILKHHYIFTKNSECVDRAFIYRSLLNISHLFFSIPWVWYLQAHIQEGGIELERLWKGCSFA